MVFDYKECSQRYQRCTPELNLINAKPILQRLTAQKYVRDVNDGKRATEALSAEYL